MRIEGVSFGEGERLPKLWEILPNGMGARQIATWVLYLAASA